MSLGVAFTEVDKRHMAQALALAARGLNTTMPNPRVGCILARHDEVIGMGWHEVAGGPHAEVVALRQAGAKATGTCAYVTLEPCSHYGRTPPCATALIQAGVTRVVVAMIDPNPKVSSRGLEMLRQANIEVCCGLMSNEAVDLNLGFLARMRRGRPWVRLRISCDVGAGMALRQGNTSAAISPLLHEDVERLWARSCGVLTGVKMVLNEDPIFAVSDPAVRRQPIQIVLDSRLRTPASARILRGRTTWIFTVSDDEQRTRALTSAGAKVVLLSGEHQRLSLRAVLEELGRRELNEITVEAGPSLCSALLREHLVDEMVYYGEEHGPLGQEGGGLMLSSLGQLTEANRFQLIATEQVGLRSRATLRLPYVND